VHNLAQQTQNILIRIKLTENEIKMNPRALENIRLGHICYEEIIPILSAEIVPLKKKNLAIAYWREVNDAIMMEIEDLYPRDDEKNVITKFVKYYLEFEEIFYRYEEEDNPDKDKIFMEPVQHLLSLLDEHEAILPNKDTSFTEEMMDMFVSLAM